MNLTKYSISDELLLLEKHTSDDKNTFQTSIKKYEFLLLQNVKC